MDKPPTLDSEIRKLATERDQLLQLKVSITAQEAEVAQTIEGKRLEYLKEQYEAINNLASERENVIRKIAVNQYDGENKQPHPAITIKTFALTSYDPGKMKAWAIEHNHPGILKLDTKIADAVAKGPIAPDFVYKSTENRATIKSDLSDYIIELVVE